MFVDFYLSPQDVLHLKKVVLEFMDLKEFQCFQTLFLSSHPFTLVAQLVLYKYLSHLEILLYNKYPPLISA